MVVWNGHFELRTWNVGRNPIRFIMILDTVWAILRVSVNWINRDLIWACITSSFYMFRWLTSFPFDSVHQIVLIIHRIITKVIQILTCSCWWEVEENPETQFKHDVTADFTAEMLSGLLLLVHIHFCIAHSGSLARQDWILVCLCVYIYKRICCDLIYRGGNVMTHARLGFSQRENPFSLVGSIERRVSALHEILNIYIRRSTFFFSGYSPRVCIYCCSQRNTNREQQERILHMYLHLMNRAGEDRLLYALR